MITQKNDFQNVFAFYPMLGLHCRHETPVLSKPIDVIHLSEDLVVLDKPCSLPVSVENILYYSENMYMLFLPLSIGIAMRVQK